MKRIILLTTLVLSLMLNGVLLFNTFSNEAIEHSDDPIILSEETVIKQPVTNKTENSKLIFIEPKFKTIELIFNDSVSLEIDDDSTILAVSASYTKKYHWSAFDHKLIAGNHVSDGNLYEGYECHENTGAFIYANKHWSFVHRDIDKYISELAGVSDACAFAQTMLVYEGKILPIPKTLPSKKYIRRALCDIHNKLVMVESKNKLTLEEFSDELLKSGVHSAICLDMGAMSYSIWREYSNDSIKTLYPVNNLTKYSTNYLRFKM